MLALLLTAAGSASPAGSIPAAHAQAATQALFPASVSQGALVLGRVAPGSLVRYAGRTLRVTAYGTVVFGVGRNQTGPLQVQVTAPGATMQTVSIAVAPRSPAPVRARSR